MGIYLTDEELRQALHEANDSKKYLLYNTDIDSLTREELENYYSSMQNYLSDARTHSY